MRKNTLYGIGGYDPTKPNNNIVSEEILSDIVLPKAVEDRIQAIEDAITTATSLADLRAKLLAAKAGP